MEDLLGCPVCAAAVARQRRYELLRKVQQQLWSESLFDVESANVVEGFNSAREHFMSLSAKLTGRQRNSYPFKRLNRFFNITSARVDRLNNKMAEVGKGKVVVSRCTSCKFVLGEIHQWGAA